MTNNWQITADSISYTARTKHRVLSLSTSGQVDVRCSLSQKSLNQTNTADNIATAPKAVLAQSKRNAPALFSFIMKQPVRPTELLSFGDGLTSFYTGDIAYFAYRAADLDDNELMAHEQLLSTGHVKSIGSESNIKYVIDTGALEL